MLSDPFGRGWDLFGTRHFKINYRLVSTQTIALVQALAIVIGHIGGVVLAHDRALELFGPKAAWRSQLPLLGGDGRLYPGGSADSAERLARQLLLHRIHKQLQALPAAVNGNAAAQRMVREQGRITLFLSHVHALLGSSDHIDAFLAQFLRVGWPCW